VGSGTEGRRWLPGAWGHGTANPVSQEEQDGGRPEEALAELVAEARAWLVWEWHLGGGLVPAQVGLLGSADGEPDAAEGRTEAPGEPTGTPSRPPAAPSRSPEPGEEAIIGRAPGADRRKARGAGLADDPSDVSSGGTDGPPSLAVLRAEAAACTRCALHENRTKSVFSRGSETASIAFVGEGPGYHEDQQGAPFVGKAGQLLDRMVAAMGYDRDEVYVCNVVKCRPPENRTPLPPEADACRPFLEGQLATVAPDVIVALGKCAAEHLGCVPESGPWRGRWGSYRGVPVMPTYHPAFLLRNPAMKRPVWEDLQAVLARLGRTPPPRGAAGPGKAGG